MKDKTNKKTKGRKSFRITRHEPHPVWVAFDQHISLFIVPLLVFIRAVVFIQTTEMTGFVGAIAGIWILFAVIATIASGLFLLANRYWLRWRVNWWKNILLSIVIFLASTFVLGYIIRYGV